MEVGDKLRELNMTVDEIDRMAKAFKDEKFREMLHDYARELSDPENKKRYEEEIRILEQERGNTIEFIHPEPFRALRTSVNGKQKCFINICANEKVGKPACQPGVSDEGRRGQCWSLPHSLHPGRQDTDPKGNKIMIYDVIFHSDTLHMASKNKRFMDMVDSTAIQGIQNAFNVTLDKNNIRETSTKYKGTPHPCVIRKPIPGYKADKPDPLAFPYPDEKRPSSSLQTNPTEPPATKNSSDAEPLKSFQIQPQKSREPTKPNHTVKYRSFIDLQDFRCSRDSAQSPRPKEIIVTIDVPLLKAAKDASLEVKERKLLLESKKPAYRLELPLAYPVDEDKGEAKFHKQSGQLTVTLPVLPSNEAFDFGVRPAQTSVSDDERQGDKSEVEKENTLKEKESESLRNEDQGGVEEKVKNERDIEEEVLKQQTRVEKGEEEGERGQEKGEEQMREGENNKRREEIDVEEEAKWNMQMQKCQDSVEEEKLKEQKQKNEEKVGKSNPQKRQQDEDKWISKLKTVREDKCESAAEKRDSGVTNVPSETVERRMVSSDEHTTAPKYSGCTVKEGGINRNLCMQSTPKMTTSDLKEDTEKPQETVNGNLRLERDAAFLRRSSEAVSPIPPDAQSQNVKDLCISWGTEGSSETPATNNANKSSRGGSHNSDPLCAEELATGSVKPEQKENVDEDDLPTEQTFHNPEHDNKPPPVLLREIDKDGNEMVIGEHSTSAGFVFQNSLMYELE
uniref:protein kintoun n=1 Tax=Scatophagus argus TaxID=75038 RepID=UPI001ED7F527|nr:protein kintoun [Scatophagus argus]XP_046269217.1 protein kintoun [Scatophagus argus]